MAFVEDRAWSPELAAELTGEAKRFFAARGLDRVPIWAGEMWGARGVLVEPSSALAQAKAALAARLRELGYRVSASARASVPHIDLRGQARDVLNAEASLQSDWQP